MSAKTFVAPKTITRQQIIDALAILGLDSGQTLHLDMDSAVVSVEVLGVHEGGVPGNIEFAHLPTTRFHIPIVRERE